MARRIPGRGLRGTCCLGNRRIRTSRPEQQDRLTEQLGSGARRRERAAEDVDELQKRLDGGSCLRTPVSRRVASEPEGTAGRVNLAQELRELLEESPLRRARRGLDRPTTKKRDEVERPIREPAHPAPDRRLRHAVLALDRYKLPPRKPRAGDGDHLLDRSPLAWECLVRKRSLVVAAHARLADRDAQGKAAANDVRSEPSAEPDSRQLELRRSALRAVTTVKDLGSTAGHDLAVPGKVPCGYVHHTALGDRGDVRQTTTAVAFIFDRIGLFSCQLKGAPVTAG